MGPEANVLLPAVTISSLLFWTVGSHICPSSTEPSQFPLEAITCHTPGNAEAWITNWVIKYWVCCALNCMTTSRNVTDWDVTKLELESDSDVHLSEDEGRWHYWHKLHRVDWQYKLLIYCTCSPQIYRGSQCVMTKRATPHQLRPFLL